MTDQHKKPALDLAEVLENNPKISKSVIDQYEDLKQQLEKIGVTIKEPRYELSPAFGDIISPPAQKSQDSINADFKGDPK